MQLAETGLSVEGRLQIATQVQQLLGVWQTEGDTTMGVLPAGSLEQSTLSPESPERKVKPACAAELTRP